MNKVAGFVKLIRPVNCLMMGFAVIVGASLVIADSFLVNMPLKILLGFITGFTLTGASMAINDYCDREIDMINEPNRPIPSGTINPEESLIFAAVLTAFGFAAAFLTNLPCSIIAVVSWVVSVTYVTKGKRTGLPGNFLVSACVAIPFIYGSFVVSQDVVLNAVVFTSLAFLSVTGREVAKGIVDVKGDETRKIRTVAVTRGEKTAAHVASIFFLSAVSLSFLPVFLGSVSGWFIPFVAVTDLGFILSSAMLIRENSQENAKRVKNMALLWMITGLIAFLAGTIR